MPSGRVARPAISAQLPVLALCGAAMRGAVGVAGCAAAVLAPSSHPLWWVAVGSNSAWTAFFVRTALRRGLSARLVGVEVGLTALLCLGQRWILPAGALPDGVSWIAVILTSSMVMVNFVHPAQRAVPICLLLLVSHLVGARWAGASDGGVGSAIIHALQIGSLALLMTLVRRAAHLADDVMAGLRHEQQVSAAAGSRRREEEARSDELHNKVLATLSVVATGGVTTSTPLLRDQAAVAAQVLAALRTGPAGSPAEGVAAGRGTLDEGTADGPVSLARRLRSVADAAAVPVDAALAEVMVPAAVADAVAGAVEEALANVDRHAGVGRARLRLSAHPGMQAESGAGAEATAGAGAGAGGGAGGVGVRVEVADDGTGFDPAAVPTHRYGLRHAVLGAMRRVGGEAAVESSPGGGTRVLLRWPS